MDTVEPGPGGRAPAVGGADIDGGSRDSEPVDQGRWEPGRVYLVGDTVVDDDVHPAMDEDDYPTPGGRFRALVDHYSGVLGPRFLEIDAPGVWERLGAAREPVAPDA